MSWEYRRMVYHCNHCPHIRLRGKPGVYREGLVCCELKREPLIPDKGILENCPHNNNVEEANENQRKT